MAQQDLEPSKAILLKALEDATDALETEEVPGIFPGFSQQNGGFSMVFHGFPMETAGFSQEKCWLFLWKRGKSVWNPRF